MALNVLSMAQKKISTTLNESSASESFIVHSTDKLADKMILMRVATFRVNSAAQLCAFVEPPWRSLERAARPVGAAVGVEKATARTLSAQAALRSHTSRRPGDNVKFVRRPSAAKGAASAAIKAVQPAEPSARKPGPVLRAARPCAHVAIAPMWIVLSDSAVKKPNVSEQPPKLPDAVRPARSPCMAPEAATAPMWIVLNDSVVKKPNVSERPPKFPDAVRPARSPCAAMEAVTAPIRTAVRQP